MRSLVIITFICVHGLHGFVVTDQRAPSAPLPAIDPDFLEPFLKHFLENRIMSMMNTDDASPSAQLLKDLLLKYVLPAILQQPPPQLDSLPALITSNPQSPHVAPINPPIDANNTSSLNETTPLQPGLNSMATKHDTDHSNANHTQQTPSTIPVQHLVQPPEEVQVTQLQSPQLPSTEETSHVKAKTKAHNSNPQSPHVVPINPSIRSNNTISLNETTPLQSGLNSTATKHDTDHSSNANHNQKNPNPIPAQPPATRNGKANTVPMHKSPVIGKLVGESTYPSSVQYVPYVVIIVNFYI